MPFSSTWRHSLPRDGYQKTWKVCYLTEKNCKYCLFVFFYSFVLIYFHSCSFLTYRFLITLMKVNFEPIVWKCGERFHTDILWRAKSVRIETNYAISAFDLFRKQIVYQYQNCITASLNNLVTTVWLSPETQNVCNCKSLRGARYSNPIQNN